MLQFSSKPSIKSSIISLTIIATLMVIAIVIFNQQFNYNPAVTALFENSDMSGLTELKAIVRLVKPLQPLSSPEIFDKVTLSDKIDGKAELYLPAGFKSLICQRFRLKSHSDSDKSSKSNQPFEQNSSKSTTPSNLWIELFVYDMTLPENAFAVFSRQRRENATQISIATYAYQTDNAIFFVHGHFYLEMIASYPSLDAVKLMIEVGKAFIDDNLDLAPKKMDVPDLFPTQVHIIDEQNRTPKKNSIKLDKESITLTASDAFGFDRFDRVYTAIYKYTINDSTMSKGLTTTANSNISTITAFISKRASSEEAAKLAGDYSKFLTSFGGNPVDLKKHSTESNVNLVDSELEELYGVEIMETIELIFSSGEYIAGVRETEDIELSLKLVQELGAKISENNKQDHSKNGKSYGKQ